MFYWIDDLGDRLYRWTQNLCFEQRLCFDIYFCHTGEYKKRLKRSIRIQYAAKDSERKKELTIKSIDSSLQVRSYSIVTLYLHLGTNFRHRGEKLWERTFLQLLQISWSLKRRCYNPLKIEIWVINRRICRRLASSFAGSSWIAWHLSRYRENLWWL